ncbi:MAG: TetR family transcriptional regulator [Rhodobacteraceae bacterium]|nr:TetR family transcriptional regulator [Paracoccaceae bacterium]
MSSLRERRRQRTEETIRHAAVDLASELGLDNVTTDMISKAAGISPRTFFNYFSYKEAAFLPPALNFPEGDVERFTQGTGTLLADITSLMKPLIDQIGDDRDFVRRTHEIANANPKLLLLRISAFHEFEVIIAGLIEKRLAFNNESGDACHMAALISASIRRGFEVWVTSESKSVGRCITAKIEAISTIFPAR